MTTDADKVRFLANLAEVCMAGDKPDYPNSLDAIARDLLPLLREKGWGYSLTWEDGVNLVQIWNPEEWPPLVGHATHATEPARAAFEAIFEALHGGEE